MHITPSVTDRFCGENSIILIVIYLVVKYLFFMDKTLACQSGLEITAKIPHSFNFFIYFFGGCPILSHSMGLPVSVGSRDMCWVCLCMFIYFLCKWFIYFFTSNYILKIHSLFTIKHVLFIYSLIFIF